MVCAGIFLQARLALLLATLAASVVLISLCWPGPNGQWLASCRKRTGPSRSVFACGSHYIGHAWWWWALMVLLQPPPADDQALATVCRPSWRPARENRAANATAAWTALPAFFAHQPQPHAGAVGARRHDPGRQPRLRALLRLHARPGSGPARPHGFLWPDPEQQRMTYMCEMLRRTPPHRTVWPRVASVRMAAPFDGADLQRDERRPR